jgi:TonB family protein
VTRAAWRLGAVVLGAALAACATGSGGAAKVCPSPGEGTVETPALAWHIAEPQWKGPAATAMLQFVVNAAGLVDTTTVHVLSTSDSAYAKAAIAVLPKFRFTPASVAKGCPVKQVVQIPFEFPKKRAAPVY